MRFSRRSLPLMAALTLVLAAGCGGGSDTPAPARIRVFNASPDTPVFQLLVDDATLLNNVAYREVRDFFEIASGTRNFKAQIIGGGSGVSNAFNISQPLLPGTTYTLFAVGRRATLGAILTPINVSPPAQGNFRLSIATLALLDENVDIYLTNPVADLNTERPDSENVGIRSFVQYGELRAGVYRIRITSAGSKNVLIDSGTLTPTAGQVRTLVAVGAPGIGSPLELVTLPEF